MSAFAELARAIASKARETRSSEHLATVLRKDSDGTYWVSIPGGADETPVSTAMAEASAGDVVRVSIADGRCVMTGNVTSPSASSATVNEVRQVANKAYTTAYEESARIDELETTKLTAMEALITELQVDTGSFDKLFADTTTSYVVVADNATAAHLEAAVAKADELSARLVKVTQATVDMLLADSASVSELNAETAVVSSAAIAALKANVATIAKLRTDKADIDAANINTATIRTGWVDQLLVQSGLLSKSGTIYTIDAIQVNAASIKAGTIDVDRLVVSVTENNETHKYLVHVDTSGSTPVTTYQKLDGDVIGDHTITADKIVAHSLTADEITTSNLVGTGGWINLASGTFSYGTSNGDHISWDGTNLSISASSITTQITNGVQSAVSSLSTVGENLLLKTAFVTDDSMSCWNAYNAQNLTNTELSIIDGILKLKYLQHYNDVSMYHLKHMSVVSGDKYKFQVKAKSSLPSTGYQIGVLPTFRTTSNVQISSCSSWQISNSWQDLTFTVTVTSTSTDCYFVLVIYSNGIDATNQTVEFKEMKLEKGNVATPWSPAPEDIVSTAVTSQHSGENLLLRTGLETEDAESVWLAYTSSSGSQPSVSVEAATYVTVPCNMLVFSSCNASSQTLRHSTTQSVLKAGKYTFSCYVKSSTGTIKFTPTIMNTSWVTAASSKAASATTSWKKISVTMTVASDVNGYAFAILSGYDSYFRDDHKLYFREMKLERGDAATPWTPSPSDLRKTMSESDELSTMVRQYSDGVLVCREQNSIGALVDADGSFDIVAVSWSGSTPTAGDSLSSFSADVIRLGSVDDAPYEVVKSYGSYAKTTTTSNGSERSRPFIELPQSESGYPAKRYAFPVEDGVYIDELSNVSLGHAANMGTQGDSSSPTLVIDAEPAIGQGSEVVIPGYGYLTRVPHDGHFDSNLEARSLDPDDFPYMYVAVIEYNQQIADAITAIGSNVNEYLRLYFDCTYCEMEPASGSTATLAMRVGGRGALPVYKYKVKPPESIIPASPSIVVTEDGEAWLAIPDE